NYLHNSRNTNASSNTLEGSIRQNTNEDNQNLQTNNEISSVNIDLSINRSTESIIPNMNNDHHDNERVLINIAEINNNGWAINNDGLRISGISPPFFIRSI
ncbi:unnamed protein product, partial [Rotaria magnacalcarata]